MILQGMVVVRVEYAHRRTQRYKLVVDLLRRLDTISVDMRQRLRPRPARRNIFHENMRRLHQVIRHLERKHAA